MIDNDRNFDDLSLRFAHKIYGGLKGKIRLAVIWRDLQQILPALEQQAQGRPLRILDIGGGLGQISIRLAEQGHKIVFNDISENMLAAAKVAAQDAGVAAQFDWIAGPYQALPHALAALKPAHTALGFDLILCHALLEWLDEPALLMDALAEYSCPGGLLSLCFYNPASKVYRNLIRGNFKVLSQGQDYQSDKGSLTPNNPSQPETVKHWLRERDFELKHVSGLRVFHDYVFDKRGGHQHDDEVIAMELTYSSQEPYKWLGRYLHFVCENSRAL